MRTILITGSTDGIGKLTALKLSKAGHHLILHGRNEQKLENTKAELVDISDESRVSGYVADLSDLKEVEHFGKQIKADFPKLDVLINNAGVFHAPEELTSADLDIRFVVNYLAPYVLTKVLLPTLTNHEESRIINLSSAAQSPVSINAILGHERLIAGSAYAQSKLALTMWSFALAKELSDTMVIAVNPGSLLNTKMVAEAFGQHWSPVDKGADILVRLATEPGMGNYSGQYFDNDKGNFGQAHSDAYNDKLISTLIAETENLLNK